MFKEELPDRFETMAFDELVADEVSGPILEETALEYLKALDKESDEYKDFIFECTGKLIETGNLKGYLERRDKGLPRSKPSAWIIGETDRFHVMQNTLKKLGVI